MRHKWFLLAFFAAALLCVSMFGCSESPTAPGGPVFFETLHRSQSSGIEGARQQVIRDSGEWSRVWAEIGAGGAPPAVDFGRDMVILVAAGPGNGCFHIQIKSIRAVGGRPEVQVETSVPGPNCACTEQLTKPVHAVVLPRTSAPAAFELRQVRLTC